MRNRTLISFSLALAMLVVACDEPVGPGQTGSIALQFVIPEPPTAAPADSSAVDDDAPDPERRRERPDAQPDDDADIRATESANRSVDGEDASEASRTTTPVSVPNSDTPLRAAQPGTIETARAIVSGPTDTVVDLTVTTTEITGTIQGLTPGSYVVTVEGLIGGAVDHYGQATGVTVQSEQTATATITFASFLPDLSGFGLTSTTAFAFNVTFPAVNGATNYDVMWDTDPGFGANPDSATSVGPNPTVTVGQATTYYVRARSRNVNSANVGRWSVSQSVDVTPAPSGTPGAPTPTLGDTLVPSAADTAVTIDVNVDVPGSQSWFTTPVCMGDTLTFRAVAANLSPASPLDTYLRIVRALPATDTIATNNDANGTDAEIMMVMPEVDSVRILVGGENNTVGHFELRVRRAAGLGRSPPGSCLGVVPDRLAFRTIAGGTAGSPFTVEVEIQDEFGALVPAAASQVTLDMGMNPGSMVFHMTDYDTEFRNVDYLTPTIFPDFAPGVFIGEPFGATYDSTNGRFLWVDFQQHLYQTDPVTGQTDTIAQSLTTRMRGIAFIDNGTRLIGASRDANEIFEIDPSNGNQVLLGPVTGITPSVGFNAMATDPTTGNVYAASKLVPGFPGAKERELIWFDPATLAGTVVDTFDIRGVAGLAFAANGDLIAVGGDGSENYPATLVLIDKATALVSDGLTGMGTSNVADCCGEAITTRPAFVSGTLSQNAVNGVATFNDIQIDATQSGYTLMASATGLTGAESAPFSVTSGTVSNLPVRVDVVGSVTMFPYGDTVTLPTPTLLDADGNTVGGATFSYDFVSGHSVDASGVVTSNPATAFLGRRFVNISDAGGVAMWYSDTTALEVVPMPVALVAPQTGELSEILDSLNANVLGFAFDTINVAFSEPTVAQLQNYAAVLLWTNCGPNNPMLLGTRSRPTPNQVGMSFSAPSIGSGLSERGVRSRVFSPWQPWADRSMCRTAWISVE